VAELEGGTCHVVAFRLEVVDTLVDNPCADGDEDGEDRVQNSEEVVPYSDVEVEVDDEDSCDFLVVEEEEVVHVDLDASYTVN
jgi:hypothetical protein